MILFPNNVPSLPLENSEPDSISEDYRIDFVKGRMFYKALVYDDHELIVDLITGKSFEEVYDVVRNEYPQAKWDNPNA